jgi:hypothetical protein
MFIKLSLLLLVSIAIVEEIFFVMHIIESKLQNRMRNKLINDNLVVYIEKNIFDEIDNELIMKCFSKYKNSKKTIIMHIF